MSINKYHATNAFEVILILKSHPLLIFILNIVTFSHVY